MRRARDFGLPAPRLEFVLVIDGRRYIARRGMARREASTLEFDGRDPHMRRTVHDYDTDRRNDLQSTQDGVASASPRPRVATTARSTGRLLDQVA